MLPTTAEQVNTCSCSVATFAGIVNIGKSWLDEERLYHTWGPMPSHPWCCKHCISIWVHGCDQRRIPVLGPDPTTCVNINQCRHFYPCSCLPLSFSAAIWSYRCEVKMNLHPRHLHYATVGCSGRKSRGNIQSCVGYRVCFRTRGVVLCTSSDVEIV